MKMDIFFGNMFWGILIITIGFVYISKGIQHQSAIGKGVFCHCNHYVWCEAVSWLKNPRITTGQRKSLQAT